MVACPDREPSHLSDQACGAIGLGLGALFQLERAPCLRTVGFKTGNLAVTEIKATEPVLGVTSAVPCEDAYLLCLQVQDMLDHQIWENGRALKRCTLRSGCTTIRDLKRSQAALIDQPHHTLFFYLPRSAFDEVADDVGALPVGELSYEPALAIEDGVIKNLANCLRSALAVPEQANRPFVEHVLRATAAHVLSVYGGMAPRSKPAAGGLARWQERRAKEILRADLDGNTSLSTIALQCGLSVSQLSRGFKQSVGTSPHRWLIRQRVEAAKQHLADRRLPLREIALACGFADQSHLTRVFASHTGLTPAAWQRSS